MRSRVCNVAMLRAVVVATLLLAAAAFAGTPLPKAEPSEVGMSASKLAEIPVRMKQFIKDRKIAGAVTLVARKGKIVHLEAVGDADIEARRPMRTDTIHWLASMAKPTTSVGLMVLVDEGKVSLEDPVSKFIPQFKQAKLRSGPPAREIIVRQLLNHTSGLAQPYRNPNDGVIPLAPYSLSLLQRPLEFEPGSAYEYGYGLTVAGHLCEVVSGKPFEVFLQERVFGPLGMKDTTFHPNEQQHKRLAKTYWPGPDGKSLVPAYNPFVTPDPTVKRTPEPSGGLFSTAPDMARFYQMMLNGGELNGKRIVSKAAVEEMTRPSTAGGKPITYALGWQTVKANPNAKGPQLEGYGHGGAFATDGFVDPQKELVTVLMIQRTLFPNGGEVGATFKSLVAEAVER